jgi:hypothetical protein
MDRCLDRPSRDPAFPRRRHPERVPDVAGIKTANSDNLMDTGFFKAERLVNAAEIAKSAKCNTAMNL